MIVLLALFLEWVEKHKTPATYAWRSNYLQSFVKFLNGTSCGLLVADFKPFHNRLADIGSGLWAGEGPGGAGHLGELR